MAMNDMTSVGAFPTIPIAKIGRRMPEQTWLIDGLWGREGVGIIGGAPKCAKSWLGLDMAVSVASGTPCLGRFQVCHRGRTLIFLAEDAQSQVRERVENLCLHRSLELETLDVQTVETSVLRLDSDRDRTRLVATVKATRPALLLLDPLVRMHRLDENNSGDISNLLGFLRELQRECHLAIVLVHHMTKRIRAQLGQALRGSGDLHAWGDHNAYLLRRSSGLELSVEHRAASSPPVLPLRLVTSTGRVHLEFVPTAETESSAEPSSLHERIVQVLQSQSGSLRREQLRDRLRVNNQRLGEALTQLVDRKRIVHTASGWLLTDACGAQT